MAHLDAAAVGRDLGRAVELYERIEGFARPVVASIDGAAMGGGLLLALVADLRLGSVRASFGVPEVKIGIFPALGLVPRLERMIGLGAAKRLVLTGEPIDAAEARQIGLLDRVVPGELLHEQTQALAEHLARLPPAAVELSKRAFAAAEHPDYSQWEQDQLAALWDSPERRRAMVGFLKRE
jgi:enoyl-CoA hydratase